MEEKSKKAEFDSVKKPIKQKDILTEKIKSLSNFLREKPIVSLVVTGFSLILLFWLFSSSEPEKQEIQDFKKLEERPIAGVESAVDPRVRWTEELLDALKGVKTELENLIEKKANEGKAELNNVVERLDILEEGYLNTNPIGVVDDKIINSNQNPKSINAYPSARQLKHVQRVGVIIKKDVKDYITSGAFARAVLLSGTVVGTGASAADAPKPIIMRLVDKAIFSKKLFTEQAKEAILLGSCTGNISSERAECRIDTLSLLNSSGDIIEKHQVEGWVFGEDGRAGIKGVVVDRSSEVARMAFNGILSGMAQFFQNQATNGVYPILPVAGQQNALKAHDSLKAGAYSGVGNALEKLADFAIKRAEQMNPVIVVDSGRIVDVVFRKGIDLMHDSNNQIAPISPPTQTDYSNTMPNNRINNLADNNYANSSVSSSSVTSFSKTLDKTKLQQKFTPNEEYLEEEIGKLSTEEGF